MHRHKAEHRETATATIINIRVNAAATSNQKYQINYSSYLKVAYIVLKKLTDCLPKEAIIYVCSHFKVPTFDLCVYSHRITGFNAPLTVFPHQCTY